MKLRFAAQARSHIQSIGRYIARDNMTAAQSVVRRIRAAARRLQRNPYMGHEGGAPGTREWVVRGLPYIIVYEVREQNEELVVLAVFHGARER